MSTGFNRKPGVTQLRIAPVGAIPGQGLYVFCMGSDAPGAFEKFNTGDSIEVSQLADMTGIRLIRFQAIVRPPTSVPGGASWVFDWSVSGGSSASSRVIAPGRTLRLLDGALDVSQLVGNHTIKFRLQVRS